MDHRVATSAGAAHAAAGFEMLAVAQSEAPFSQSSKQNAAHAPRLTSNRWRPSGLKSAPTSAPVRSIKQGGVCAGGMTLPPRLQVHSHPCRARQV